MIETPSIQEVEISEPPRPPQRTDPELVALPPPRRPFRRLTLVLLVAVSLVSLWLAFNLRSDLSYAASGGEPLEIGTLSQLEPQPNQNNRWVHGSGQLESSALGYRRPLDGDHFRLAPVVGNDKVWVEVRIPSDLVSERYIPPASFVGRLIHLAEAGPEYKSLLETGSAHGLSEDAWVLVDGQSPSSDRWVVGLFVMLLAFAAFGAVGCWRIVKPRSALPHPSAA